VGSGGTVAPSLPAPPRPIRPPPQVSELGAARGALAADVAGASALLKALVVRAEDARLGGDMAGMRRAYRRLYDLNRRARTRMSDSGLGVEGLGHNGPVASPAGAPPRTPRSPPLNPQPSYPTQPQPPRDLIAEHQKRATNHQQLLAGLRDVNRMIQRAARLRVGPPQARVVAACRAAVKAGAVAALARIVRDGEGPAAGGGGGGM
jgi:Bardet-Biedl syndrome 2 protein